MGFWGTLGIVVASGIGAYFASYLREKGKNLATRKDIAGLTRIVEDIKTENSLLVERFKSQQQLRHAALDERLKAHQQAFALWYKLRDSCYGVSDDGLGSVLKGCYDGWTDNCLYLEPEARTAFYEAMMAALAIANHNNPAGVKAAVPDGFQEKDEQIKLGEAGNVIMRAVALPALTEIEAKPRSRDQG